MTLRNAEPFAGLKIPIESTPIAARVQQVAAAIRRGELAELLGRKHKALRIHRFRYTRLDVFPIQSVIAQPRRAQAKEFIRTRGDASAAIEIVADASRKTLSVERR